MCLADVPCAPNEVNCHRAYEGVPGRLQNKTAGYTTHTIGLVACDEGSFLDCRELDVATVGFRYSDLSKQHGVVVFDFPKPVVVKVS